MSPAGAAPSASRISQLDLAGSSRPNCCLLLISSLLVSYFEIKTASPPRAAEFGAKYHKKLISGCKKPMTYQPSSPDSGMAVPPVAGLRPRCLRFVIPDAPVAAASAEMVPKAAGCKA